MDFTFSAEQDALRAVARSFLATQTPSTYVRAMIDAPSGVTDELWDKTADLGWPGLLIPGARGGSGLGLLDAVVLCEEMGKLPLPGPWLSSSVCATLLALQLGDDGEQAGLAAGTRRGTVAIEETGTRDPLDGISCSAVRRGDDWWLTGVKPLVLDGHTADFAYVVARDGDGLATFAVEQPGADPVPSLDVTRKMTRLVLDDRPARRVGPAHDQRALLMRVIDDIGIALCAESVGACDRALEMATEYAKARVQFDRPIATFQVIKHKIVDMLHQLELARVATHYAAWTSQVDDPQRATAAAAAKGFVAEAATMITGENIQVHGGIGFTWDLDCHLLFRRVKANDVLFGRQGWQRQRLADLILDRA
ncbi:MAG: acyl-CoA dehydrogenase family protein [Acidimicrobiales bacterium]